MFHRDCPLLRQLLDLVGAILLPVVDVGVIPHAKWTAGEDDGTNVVVESGCTNGFLVGFRCACFFRQDEACPNPDSGGAEHKGCGQRLAVEETASGDTLNGLTSQWGGGFSAHLGNGGNEDGGGDVTGMAATFAALRTDHIRTDVKALLDVLGVADHVHIENACLVESVDDWFRGHTDGGDEEFGAGVDDNVNELVKFALGVVVTVPRKSG